MILGALIQHWLCYRRYPETPLRHTVPVRRTSRGRDLHKDVPRHVAPRRGDGGARRHNDVVASTSLSLTTARAVDAPRLPPPLNLSGAPALPGIAVTKRLWEIRAEHRRSTVT